VIQFFWGARGTLTGQRYTEPGTVTDIARATRGDGTLAQLTTTVNSVVTDTTSVVWDPTLPVAQPVWTGDPGGTNATRAVYGPDLIRFTCPTGTGCTGPANHDLHGSALRTSATSAITQDNTYGPWGNAGPVFTENLNYGYRSELHTGDTIHLRARDYDPETGLFISPDPLDGVDGATTVNNPYHYADNDPINNVDPLGLRTSDGAIDAGAVGAACDDAGGHLVMWGDSGVKVCLEPPASGREGDPCWPPAGPGGQEIVYHQGACATSHTEVVCEHGASIPGLNRICRNSDAIRIGLGIVAIAAVGVAATAAVVTVGGASGVMVTIGGGGGASLAAAGPTAAVAATGGVSVVISPALAGALAVSSSGALLATVGNAGGVVGGGSGPRDYADRNTQNSSAQFGSEREARAFAQQKVGPNPRQVEPYKLRSQDGRWQYRAKPGDVAQRHIHLELLDPKTGRVIQNVHLRW
jgi:RHS repeat-associated protein